jgi:hypothetical protein
MTQIEGPTQSFTYSSTIPGNLRGRGIDTLTAPLGPYLVCGWVDDSGQTLPPVATATASFTLRAPRFTMALSTPSHARLRHRGTFTVHGTSEISAHMSVEVLPACFQLRQTHAGIRCAARPVHNCKATPKAESNYIEENNDLGIQAVTLISREIPHGGFNLKRTVTFGHGWIPARHMVCAWIGVTNSHGDPDSQVYLGKSASVTPRPDVVLHRTAGASSTRPRKHHRPFVALYRVVQRCPFDRIGAAAPCSPSRTSISPLGERSRSARRAGTARAIALIC